MIDKLLFNYLSLTKIMEKNFLWIIIAILSCGLTMTTIISCGNDDANNNGGDTEVTVGEPTLLGGWLTAVEIHNEDKYEMKYLLVSFDENGVATMRSYQISLQEAYNYSERMRRHVTYSVDEVDGIFELNYESGVETNYFKLTKDSLLVSILKKLRWKVKP